MKSFEQIIKDVWFGREILWKVFWIYSGILSVIISILVDATLLAGYFTLSVILFAFYTIFTIWASKGLYACRFNVKNPTIIKTNLVTGFAILNIFWLVYFMPGFFKEIQSFRENPDLLEQKIAKLKNKPL